MSAVIPADEILAELERLLDLRKGQELRLGIALVVLSERGIQPFSSSQLADLTGMTPRRCREMAERLVAAGVAVRHSSGMISPAPVLTGAGSERAREAPDGKGRPSREPGPTPRRIRPQIEPQVVPNGAGSECLLEESPPGLLLSAAETNEDPAPTGADGDSSAPRQSTLDGVEPPPPWLGWAGRLRSKHAGQPVTLEERRLWLEEEWEVIEVESRASALDKGRPPHVELERVLHRFFGAYLRGPRRFGTEAQRRRIRARGKVPDVSTEDLDGLDPEDREIVGIP